jgi:PAS domain S-box-containing protein
MTAPKQAEDNLKECERKFLNALEECPMAVTLTSATDHHYIEVNNTFERMSGWKRTEIIGRTPFDINIWVDPGDRIEFVKRLLSGGSVKNLDVHARLKNREVWVGVGYGALIEINGETCVLSLIASIEDFKESEKAKQAEQTLSSMARRLIQAQEGERVAVARELHNYIDRLLLVSANVGRSPASARRIVIGGNQQIAEATRDIENLVSDMQSLSERLHSSKVEYLGLAAAAASLCKELSNKKEVEIKFASEEVAKKLPPDVSLCLFRVLQETLQNALSHTGSESIEVLLRSESNEVCLTVRSTRFDFEDSAKALPLGLIIIKERLKLVDGEFSVQSQAGRGTTIQARVPLHTEIDSAGGAV